MADRLEEREEKLRRSLLTSARVRGAALTGGWIGGAMLADDARDADQHGIDSDEQAGRLIGELLQWGLLEEEANVHLAGVARTLRHRRFRLTQKGWGLLMSDVMVPPIPGVWDPRLN